MKYSRPRGTQDIVPPEAEKWRAVERVFLTTFDRFSYRGIRTPIFESTDLFVRAVGEASDIVSKEMYSFKDRGGRHLTLRPENTASVIRAYLENGMHRWGGVQRLYYIGPMFRYDRPQSGRYRQFHQVGAEAIGSDNPAVDVEMIHVVVSALEDLGFEELDVRLNSVGTEASRGPYRKVLLDAIEGVKDELPPEVVERYRKNPLRIFDAKETSDELKARLPLVTDHLVDEDASHFARVKELLDQTGVHYTEDRRLVRGLDYYTKTVFEIYYGDRGAQSALCGGGRYDSLVEECGGPATPAIGFSVGLERVIDALPKSSPVHGDDSSTVQYYVAAVGDGAAAAALSAARTLRKFGNTETDLSGRSRKKQVQVAEKSDAAVLVIADESAPGRLTWRSLSSRDEKDIDAAALETHARNIQEEAGK